MHAGIASQRAEAPVVPEEPDTPEAPGRPEDPVKPLAPVKPVQVANMSVLKGDFLKP